MDYKVIITNQMLVIIIELLFLGFGGHFLFVGASLVAQKVKNLHAMQETQVQSLSREDSLEKRMATHSSTLAWRIPWAEEPGGLHVHGVEKSQTWLSNSLSLLFVDIFFIKIMSNLKKYSIAHNSTLCNDWQKVASH